LTSQQTNNENNSNIKKQYPLSRIQISDSGRLYRGRGHRYYRTPSPPRKERSNDRYYRSRSRTPPRSRYRRYYSYRDQPYRSRRRSRSRSTEKYGSNIKYSRNRSRSRSKERNLSKETNLSKEPVSFDNVGNTKPEEVNNPVTENLDLQN